MLEVKELGSRPHTVKTGVNAGKTKFSVWCEFECPSCGNIVERQRSAGKKRLTCGAKGCAGKASDKYGHRKMEYGSRLKDIKYYDVVNDFYNRNVVSYTNRCKKWDTFEGFRSDMLESYTSVRNSGANSATLFVCDHDPISESNCKWIDAATSTITDFSADRLAGVYHSKMAAVELNMQHCDLLKVLGRMKSVTTSDEELVSELGLLSRPTMAKIISKDAYISLINRVTDVRSGKESTNVYIVSGGGLYKIGISGDVSSRLATMRGTSPVRLDLIHTVPVDNARLVEKSLHEKYKDFNSHGEWFKLSPEQLQEVKDYLDNL